MRTGGRSSSKCARGRRHGSLRRRRLVSMAAVAAAAAV
jgi:hypothetical protein